MPSTLKKVNSPPKPTKLTIVQTLRLTMSQTDPEQLAQGLEVSNLDIPPTSTPSDNSRPPLPPLLCYEVDN